MNRLYEGPTHLKLRGTSLTQGQPDALQTARWAVPAYSSGRSTSPSPDPDALRAVTNHALVHAALHSNNPYLRAGVFAVADRAASSARRSGSTHDDKHVTLSLSRSRSPSIGLGAPLMKPTPQGSTRNSNTAAASRPTQPTKRQTSLDATTPTPCSIRKRGQSEVTSDQRARARRSSTLISNRLKHSVDHHTSKHDDYEYQTCLSDEEESNVLITDGTVMEAIASSPSTLRRRRGHNWSSHEPGDAHEDYLTSSSNDAGRMVAFAPNVARPSDNMTKVVAHHRTTHNAADPTGAPPQRSEDMFEKLMDHFSSNFGLIRPSSDYVVLTLTTKSPAKATPRRAIATPPHVAANIPTVVEDVQESQMAPVFVSFAASPDRRAPMQISSGTTTSTHAPLDVSEKLTQLTFTCTYCHAKHMRGLQCSRCQRPLPQLRRCGDCASWMRGRFCSACGARQPAEEC
jgi:hypothetical protein